MKWHEIDWKKVNLEVLEVQKQIIRAYLNHDSRMVKQLQWKLIRSFSCRAAAVRRIITNSGNKTPGVDGDIWDTHEKRYHAIKMLGEHTQNSKGYKALRMKRVWIPKPNGDKRPLGIPTMTDRAMQSVHYMATDPIVEILSDSNSYGFRKSRSPHNAMAKIWDLLNKESSPKWILDADIKGCFDNIDHNFLLQGTPMCDLESLDKWLKAGLMNDGHPFPTTVGTPQGGIISPMLANVALNGLESIKTQYPSRITKEGIRYSTKINCIRFADDFIFTSENKKLSEDILEKIKEFLTPRTLSIHQGKTQIINLSKGFDFLGFRISKHPRNKNRRNQKGVGKDILVIKPTQKNCVKFKDKVKLILNSTRNPKQLITKVNPVTRGWSNYFRIHTHSTKVVREIGAWLWRKTWKWARKKHPSRGASWIAKTYYKVNLLENTDSKGRVWDFRTRESNATLFMMQVKRIKELYKLRLTTQINPYLTKTPAHRDTTLLSPIKKKIYAKQGYLCLLCGESLIGEELVEVDHIMSKKEGGSNDIENIQALHKICHQQKTFGQGIRQTSLIRKL